MRHEANAVVIALLERCESRHIERLRVGRAQRPVHRPFEASHVGKVDKRCRRRKMHEEFGKLGSVLVEVGAHRRPLVHEDSGGSLEELIADQPADCRVGQAQGVGQVTGERIAINGQTPLRSKTIVNDVARSHVVLALDEA